MSTAATAELDRLLTSEDLVSDPYPVYRRLQEEAPVHWCQPWEQWVVTRHADVERILKSPDRFSSQGWEARFLGLLPEEMREQVPAVNRHYATPVLSNTDPPEHRRLRTMVVKSFTPRVLKGMTPVIEQLVVDMLAPLQGKNAMELISEFAYPLPATVIAQLLGAPAEAGEDYARWSADVVAFVGTGSPDAERTRRLEASLEDFRSHLEPLLQERRQNPRSDLLSHLVGEHEGETLTEAELVSTCVTLLFAGHETTANLIANGLLTLLRNPEQMSLLRERPDLMPAAVEEILRFEGPVQRVRRVATEDLELGGQQMRKGDLVMGFIGAANRDPEVFDDPDRFDVTREPTHLAFGKGIHFCVGAGLSRIEAPIAFREILSRLPDLQLAAEPSWKPNITFRGLERLDLSRPLVGGPQPQTGGAVTGTWHTGFQVACLDRSLAFYRDLLGLTVRAHDKVTADYIGTLVGYPGAEIHRAFLDIPGSSHFLELLEYRNVAREAVDPAPANPGTAHICFTVSDLEEIYERLREDGVEFVSAPVHPTVGPNVGGVAVYLRDPDDIRIELLQPPAPAEG